MPTKARKPCAYPGCSALVSSGYCDKHKSQTKTHYQHETWAYLYHTAAWKRRRKAQLAKEPWCATCLAKDIYEPATDADHVEPHRGDKEKFFHGELCSLCHRCHSAKTRDEVLGPQGGQ